MLRPVEGLIPADSHQAFRLIRTTYRFPKIVLIAQQYILQSVNQDRTERVDIFTYKI
jgi:hypothetical protein